MRLDFWHKWNLADGHLMAALILSILFGMSVTFGATVIASMTERPWFTAHVQVPNHRVGENPIVTYTRTIRRNLQGQWTVEVQQNRDGVWYEVCQGDGIAPYAAVEAGTITLRLSTYAGIIPDECITEPGLYRLVTAWYMLDSEGSSPRGFWDESNIFEVTE